MAGSGRGVEYQVSNSSGQGARQYHRISRVDKPLPSTDELIFMVVGHAIDDYYH